MIPEIESSRERIERSWDETTTFEDDIPLYRTKHPSHFQCGSTAYLVLCMYGGGLLKCTVNGQKHYMNLVNGEIVNLTMAQFPPGSTIDEGSIEPCHLREVMANWWFMERCFNMCKNFVLQDD